MTGKRIVRRWVVVLRPRAGSTAGFVAAANAVTGGVVVVSRAGAHLPGSVGPCGAGYVTWDLALGTWAPLREVPEVAAVLDRWPGVSVVDEISLSPMGQSVGSGTGGGPCVKRTLLMRLRPRAGRGQVAQWRAALLGMPEHIPEIRGWVLSEARSAAGQWTHCWEQEFASEGDLTGAYLHHPYHVTAVDPWFDPASPQSVVEPELAHLYYAADGPVLVPAQRLLPA